MKHLKILARGIVNLSKGLLVLIALLLIFFTIEHFFGTLTTLILLSSLPITMLVYVIGIRPEEDI